MVEDLQLMRDITPLFEKKVVIWGMGHRGHEVLDELIAMGAGKKGILLCDSACEIWGNIIGGQYRILSPEKLWENLEDIDPNDAVILVPVISLKAQDEILESIRESYKEAAVYTDYAIEWGIYLNINNPYIDKTYKKKKLAERRQKRKTLEKNQFQDIYIMAQKERALRYFALLPVHHDEMILVYQPGKVGSSSVYRSIAAYGRNVLHCHDLADIGENDDDLRKIVDSKRGKVICLIRDPIAREIAGMWENIHRSVCYHSEDVDFSEFEESLLSVISAKNEFRWFDTQMKGVLGIDVFQHLFDKEKGYGMIREENIELLLIKLEKLSELESVIGSFLDIDGFRLQKANVGGEKSYRFAYQEHKHSFCIPKELLKAIYQDDERIKHFYTEKERKELYKKWCQCSSFSESVE